MNKMIIVRSAHCVPIRVTKERLEHIGRRHPEIQRHEELIINTIGEPDFLQQGDYGELLAIKKMPSDMPTTYIVVVYKETDPEDGFLITSYFTRQPAKWRNVLWKR